MTALQKPLFALKPDTVHRMYANVDNRLNVFYREREYTRTIQVGTSLFPLLRLFRVQRDDQVSLYLDEDGRRMLFGVIVNDEKIIDLWHYTLDKVPPFIKTR